MMGKESKTTAVTDEPSHPQTTHDTLALPISDRTLSELALSTQSMRTSSFAMSDITDPCPPKLSEQNLESIRIRKAYSRPPSTSRITLRTMDTSIHKGENVDCFDEKDFRNTDRYIPIGGFFLMRYGFLQVPSSNCEAPEVRNRAAVGNGNGLAHSGTIRRKLLTKSKDDILIQPKKKNDVKMTAKELERTKNGGIWRSLIDLMEQFTIDFLSPRRLSTHLDKVDGSWFNERSRGFQIVGELLSGVNSWKLKPQNSVIEKPNKNSSNHITYFLLLLLTSGSI